MNSVFQIERGTRPLSGIALVLICFALSQKTAAVMPPPDGGYFGANTAEGGSALFSLTTGTNNTALGSQALFSLTTGIQNTATGAQALKNNTADKNTANGFQALVFSTEGQENVATGWRALYQNRIGSFNNAFGARALYRNTSGSSNNAFGNAALSGNTSGSNNTGLGDEALQSNTAGGWNTATGAQTLGNNQTGIFNTASGFQALANNTTGGFNTAAGAGALFNNTTGGNNIALGAAAGDELTTGDNNIAIGNGGAPGESGTIRIGDSSQNATYIAGIAGVTLPKGVPVVIDAATGQLGINATSSARFKNRIRSMDKASETILGLRPVMFCYNHEIDPNDTTQFGLVAEEVEKVDPNLVTRDADGKPYTVRYDAVNSMLLNEFLKEHRKVENLKNEFEATVAQQQKEIAALTGTVKEQAAQIQKVSTQLELSRTAPQVAENNQ